MALAVLHCSGFVLAGGEGWISDFAAAKKQAAETKKDLLVDFTGSDWCAWCIKLNEEVFSKEPFKAGVKDKFVLVEIDFPNDKSKLKEETIRQNEELRTKYAIPGFPRILLCDAEGRPFAVTGYQNGGPEAYVKSLDELRARKTARDEGFSKAAKSSGVEKARALVAALSAMGLEDELVSNFYGDVAGQIKAADPNDETGFAKASATKGRLAAYQGELNGFARRKDFNGALDLVDKTLKEGGFDRELTLQIMMTRAMVLGDLKRFDDAIKAVDEAKAFAPDSQIIPSIEIFRARLVATKGKATGTP